MCGLWYVATCVTVGCVGEGWYMYIRSCCKHTTELSAVETLKAKLKSKTYRKPNVSHLATYLYMDVHVATLHDSVVSLDCTHSLACMAVQSLLHFRLYTQPATPHDSAVTLDYTHSTCSNLKLLTSYCTHSYRAQDSYVCGPITCV